MVNSLVRVGNSRDFPLGSLTRVTVGDQQVLVVNAEGRLYAVSNRCTHRGGPLSDGELEGNVLCCPWHGGQFDIRTGVVLSPPPMKGVDVFEVQIKGSDVFLRKT